MAAATANSLGAVCVFDGENPRIVTAIAREVISGGVFVVFSGTAAGCVGSGIANFATADIEACIQANPHQVNGLALQNTASGGYVPVATRGAFLLRAGNAISGGNAVYACATGDAVMACAIDSTGSIEPIGRALSNGGSEVYVLVDLLL